MWWTAISLLLVAPFIGSIGRESQSSCKDPPVAQRFLADDVRAASPFYVLALPRTYKTEQIDNVCYTYFETGGSAFFHVISVTYKNGRNEYYRYMKEDIPGEEGVAEATALGSSPCTFHDYTLTTMPCNNTVFVLYRCFLKGSCQNIDIGRSKGVDVRVALAASPKQQQDCLTELKLYFKDSTSSFRGDYVILPQALRPQCVTKYNDLCSIGYERAAGSKEVVGPDLHDVFGDEGNIYSL